jgi:hypothetical protein
MNSLEMDFSCFNFGFCIEWFDIEYRDIGS